MQGKTKYLIPSTLGIGLVEGYDAIGFDQSLSKPELRREARFQEANVALPLTLVMLQTERRMVEICRGVKGKNEVMNESVERYKEMFMKTKIEFNKLIDVGSSFLVVFSLY